MAKIRDPAREQAYKLWLEAGGKKARKGILKEIAEKLNKSEGLIRKWKNNDEWSKGNVTGKSNGNVTNNNSNVTNRKKLIKKAKSIVVTGGTIKEAAEKTGVRESTLQNYSAKENWIDQQENFLMKIYGKLQIDKGDEHIQRRVESLDYLNYIQKKTLSVINKKENLTAKEIDSIKVYETVVSIIMKTIKGQAELLGIPDIKNTKVDKSRESIQEKVSIHEVRKKNDL